MHQEYVSRTLCEAIKNFVIINGFKCSHQTFSFSFACSWTQLWCKSDLRWLVASADWDSFQPQRTAINPGAVKLGRTPSTTSHSYLSTFQWNQLLLQKAPAPTLYVLFLQTKRVWLWKESQPWSRKPSWAAPAGCKIYLKSVSMETTWCVRAAWTIHVDIITTAIYCSLSFTCYCTEFVFTLFPWD